MAITAASLIVKVGADVSQAQRGLVQIGRSVDDTARRAQSFARSWNTAIGSLGQGALSGFAGGMGFGAITQGLEGVLGAIRGAAGDIAGTYMEYERLNMSLKAMSAQELVNAGSASTFAEGLAMSSERAKELLKWTQELAITSPYNTQDVAAVMRLGMVYGFNSEQAKRSTEAVTDFGAAMGMTGPEMERVIRALGQMKQRGKVSSQELIQLSEVGVGGLKILADAAGVTTAEMQKMIEQGLVQAGPAIEAIISAFEKTKGAAEANAGTLSGLVASYQDLKDIGEIELFGPAIQAAQPYLQDIIDGMKSPEFREGLNALGTQLGVMTGEGLTTGAAAIGAAAGAVQMLLDSDAPAWLTSLGALGVLQGGAAEVDVTPVLSPNFPGLEVPVVGKVYQVSVDETKDYGITVDATGKITETTIDLLNADGTQGGKLVFDSVAGITEVRWMADDGPGEKFTYTYDAKARINEIEIGTPLGGTKIDIAGFVDWTGLSRPGDWAEAWGSWTADFWGAFGRSGDAVMTDFRMTAAQTEINFENAGWGDNVLATLWDNLQAHFKEPVAIQGSWGPTTLGDLWTQVQAWFTEKPVSVAVQPAFSPEMSPTGITPGYQAPIDVIKPAPEAYIDPVTGEVRYRATGDDFFAGGMAIVGEEGPELVNLPRGSKIFKNSDTVRMLEAMAAIAGVPAFAEGNATPAGTWLTQSASFGVTANLIGKAANDLQKAGKEFAKEVKGATNDFTAALRGTPGLFGTSQVTARQMELAELGVPQNFADDYLRKLTDEVVNGVDWANVDIQAAAAAAGIDPNLPAQAILELFRAAWQDSSLFANPENLKLLNTDAIKETIARQQASEAGKANIMALFGVGDEELVAQIAELGLQVQNGLSQYLSEQGLGPVGAQMAAGLGTGISENGGEMGTGVVTGFGNWITSPDGMTATNAMGDTLAGSINAGFKSAFSTYDWTVPVGVPKPSLPADAAPPVLPEFASGTLSSPAGWALVGERGPELVRLPAGARVYDAQETAAMSPRISVVINAQIAQPHDVDLLAAKVARVIQRRMA